MVTHPIHARLDAIARAEYGLPGEVMFRLAMVSLASLMLAVLSDHRFLLIWLGCLLATQAALALTLKQRRPGHRAIGQFRLALSLYALSQFIFVSAPIYLIWFGTPGLMLAGGLTLVAVLLCKLQHWQADPAIATINAAQFAMVLSCIVLIELPDIEGIVNQGAVVLAAAALASYYAMTVRAHLARETALRQSRMRYAQSQKARALTQFVGGVAHDFNNILTAIMGNIELAQVLDDKSEREGALADAQKAAARAAVTVRQLLATSGRSRLRPEALSAGKLHRQMEMVLHDLLEPGIVLHSFVQHPEFEAFADRDMLETVLIQLCLNAQDAMKGSGTIMLNSRSCLERPDGESAPHAAPPYLAISVEDNGPGVDEASLEMLAEPFFTTKAVGQGPGLGLSAVQGFARQSGGTLLLGNRRGGGFCATLLLPRA